MFLYTPVGVFYIVRVYFSFTLGWLFWFDRLQLDLFALSGCQYLFLGVVFVLKKFSDHESFLKIRLIRVHISSHITGRLV